MFDPAHPGELIRETIEGLRVETGKSLTIEEVAKGLTTPRAKPFPLLSMASRERHAGNGLEAGESIQHVTGVLASCLGKL